VTAAPPNHVNEAGAAGSLAKDRPHLKHDFRQQPSGDAAERFRSWHEQETIASLRQAFGNEEATKAAVFLFVNRAYEAHMPESAIAEMFGKCIVQAGFREQHEEPAFAWLEHFAQIASAVHRDGVRPRFAIGVRCSWG
jgi:hypothetical protein